MEKVVEALRGSDHRVDGLDIVNAYFHQFYPADWQNPDRYEFTTMLGGMNGYRTTAGVSNVFPQIKCNDGFTVSVQGHRGAYSTPSHSCSKPP